MRRIAAIVGAMALAVALFALGPATTVGAAGSGTGTGTGTGTGAGDCSPGFFKNHTEFWFGLGCGDAGGLTDEQLLTMLEAKGPGSGAIRAAAAAILNDCTGCTE